MSNSSNGGDVLLIGANISAGHGSENGAGSNARIAGGDGLNGRNVTIVGGTFQAGSGGGGRNGGDLIISGGNAVEIGQVTVQSGAVFVNESVGSNANIGTGAGAVQSTVAIGSVVSGVPAGLLAAALTLLQERKATLPEKARKPAEELEQELKDTAAAASEAASKDGAADLARIGEGLRRSTELLGQVEQAGGKLANVGGLLKNAWDAVSPLLGP